MMKIKLGCDPEIFVVNQEGQPRSAHGLNPGTKTSPFKCKKGAYQVDGMALEFNIDPVTTERQWVTNIKTVMQELRNVTPSEFKFHIEPSVRFHHSHMKTQPDEAKELGCEPDFNAYTMAENPKPPSNGNMRTASGHIHIGIVEDADPNDELHRIRCCTLAKHLDLFLGIRSLEWDKDNRRRTLYGKPGAIRFKPYGLEYRVLSNKWLSSEELTRFVFRQVKACIEDLRTNGALTDKDYQNIAFDINRGSRYYTSYASYCMSEKAKKAIQSAMKLKIEDCKG